MPRTSSLTDEDKLKMVKRRDANDSVRNIAKDFDVSIPTVYGVLREAKSKQPAVSAVVALELEISLTQKRVDDLKKTIAEIASLEKQIELKKSLLRQLKELES